LIRVWTVFRKPVFEPADPHPFSFERERDDSAKADGVLNNPVQPERQGPAPATRNERDPPDNPEHHNINMIKKDGFGDLINEKGK
jgi:hypothetical protein